jgi:hypothetical protein
LQCSHTNAWVSCHNHDNDSITEHLAMNVISWASKWGQLSICPILGYNHNFWQGQEWQLLSGVLSCSQTNVWVPCQMHDNDAMTRHFAMNVIPWASNWGQATANLPHLGLQSQFWTRTRVTAAQWVFIIQRNKCLSILSDAWQWFLHTTVCNEYDSLGFKLGTTFILPYLGLQMQFMTRTGVTTAQWVFIMQTYKYLCVLSDAWQWFHNRVFYNECDSLCFKLGTTANLLYHGTKLPIVSRTGMTAAQPMFVLQ